jgi:hypothetical protein
VLRSLADDANVVGISGLPWMGKETRRLSVDALASKILCDRHNQALAPLDALSAQFIGFVRNDGEALDRLDDSSSQADLEATLTLTSGVSLELWMIKVLLGGVASRSMSRNGRAIEQWNDDVDLEHLIEVLFRGRSLSPGTGLCILPYREDALGRQHVRNAPEDIGVVSFNSLRGGLAGLTIEMGVIHLSFSAVIPSAAVVDKVGAVTLQRNAPRATKTFVLAWPEPVNGHLTLEKAEADRPFLISPIETGN